MHDNDDRDRGQGRNMPGLFAVVSLVAIAALAGFVRALLIAPLHVPLDPNEGWNAYHAAAAVIRGNPYPRAGSFMVNNYPPLSFYLVGSIGSWLGDNVVAGRLVSLVAFALVCTSIGLILRHMHARPSASLFAVLLFAVTLLVGSDYVGMNDPQLLGHAIQLAGLLSLLRRRTSAKVIVSACLFVIGGFIKHNLAVLPVATAVWLLIVDRNNGLRFTSALGAFSLAGFVATKVLLGVNLIGVLSSPRTISFLYVRESAAEWLPLTIVPLCGLSWLSFQREKHRSFWLVILYAALSIISGALFSAGAGVDVNAMFDADIALALSTGLTISHLVDGKARSAPIAGQVCAALCLLPFLIIAWRSPDWRAVGFWLDPLHDEKALAKDDIGFLRARAGPAICENLTFCYWAGKAPSVDVFNLNQQFRTGTRNPDSLLRQLRSHYFGSAQLDEIAPFPFQKNVETAFFRQFRVHHRNDNGFFFVPR